MPKSRGFTLIELLVVISIIAILSVVGFVSFQNVQKNAKDAKIKADLDAIKKAYEVNYIVDSTHPQGAYQPLKNEMFASGKIPTQPNGSPYPCSVGPDTTCSTNKTNNPEADQGYKISAALSDGKDYTVISTAGTLVQSGMLSCDPTGTLKNGLAGWWKMDENSWTVDCSTASVTDSSGNGFNGKSCPVTNGPAGGAVGKIGKAGEFDGTQDYLNIGNNATYDITGEMTVSAWVYATAAPASEGRTVASKYSWYSDRLGTGWNFGAVWTSNRYEFSVYGSDKGATALDNSFFQVLNTWKHAVGVFKPAGYVKLYIDGRLVSAVTTNIPDSINYTSSQPLIVGRRSTQGQSYFKGKIDDVRIYNRALTADEVSALYNNGSGCF